MKRSQVNDIRPAAEKMIRAHGYPLPPFAHRSLSRFRDRADAAPHVIKARVIISRGGTTLVADLYRSDDGGGFAGDRDGRVMCDGTALDHAPGDRHAFWAEGGDVPTEEVSNDNIFRAPVGRFSDIEEDTDPHHLPVRDDARWLN